MKVAFRVDANSHIGTGHFMRCLTLAYELKKNDIQIRFVSNDLPMHLREMLNKNGVEYKSLGRVNDCELIDELTYAGWLGTSQDHDAIATSFALADQVWDWVIVDHYGIDKRWETELRIKSKLRNLMVIDDLADREHDCDILLDQNYYKDMEARYRGKLTKKCRLLLGPRYALLREEFRCSRPLQRVRNGRIKKVLVFFGGIDSDNYTAVAIQALAELNQDLQVDVVIGIQHPSVELIKLSCAKFGFNCYIQSSQMAKLMLEADLAIAAGGTSTWERCALGLPTITFCVARNQYELVKDASQAGLIFAPEVKDSLMEVIRDQVKALLENPALVALISRNSISAVDGMGATRVANFLKKNEIELSRATKESVKDLFDWRNNVKIRSISKSSEIISWDEHQRWFEQVLNNDNQELLIGKIDNQAVGVLRFDIYKDTAEVSIYLVPEGKFSGQGRNLLMCGEKWLRENRPEVTIIHATVKDENTVSKNLFKDSQYLVESIFYRKIFKN